MNTNTRHWAGVTAGILGLSGHTFAASCEKYTYDASGNIVETSIGGKVTKMSFDQSNRLTASQASDEKTETTAYDAAGRPVMVNGVKDQQVLGRRYGYGNKVLEVNTNGSSCGFYYNAEGQLVGKRTNGKVSSYSWDDNVLAENNGKCYANEDHISGGVPVIESGEVVISDHLGTTLQRGHHEFNGTAFGQGQETGRFTGKIFVEELRGFLFHFRLYSPESARWSTPDPSGFPDGSNNLIYVNCDPLTGVDPLGLITHTMANPDTVPYAATPAKYGEYDPFNYADKIAKPTISNAMDGCFTPYVVGGGFKFETKGQYRITGVGLVQANANPVLNYIVDQVTVDMVKSHEAWHRTHHLTLANKTFGALETWSSSYSGYRFSSSVTSTMHGNMDMTNANSLAYQKFVTNWNRTVDHEDGGNCNMAAPGPSFLVRTQNPEWGGPLNTSLSNITIQFEKTGGDCER